MITTSGIFLDPRIFLEEQSKDELIDEILRLRQEKGVLEKELDELKKKLKPSFIKESGYKKKKRWKKLGRPVGHPGCTRPEPDHIDHVVEQTLDCCPGCVHGGLVELPSELERHVQEDIIPAHVEVTEFIRHGYWCPSCKKKHRAPYAEGEIPAGYIGPNAWVQTVLLKYHRGLPFNKIAELFGSLCGLEITEGGLAQALQRVSEWLKVETNVVLAAIRASPLLHMDETGWKINGDRHWLWAAVNKELAYYRIARSRGAKIPKEILPAKYGGTLIVDFYSAYHRLKCRIQRCLVHLEREMRKCLLQDASREYARYHKVLKRIIQDARDLKKMCGKFAPAVYIRKVSLIRKRLLRWACREHENKHLKRLAQRIMKHATELLVFLEDPEVPADNNLAERMIRPHVIIRNRSFQNRSDRGAHVHETLMSLLHTLQLQEKDPIVFFRKAVLHHAQGNPAPVLAL